MLLADVVATSRAVAVTSRRTEKVAALAALLVRAAPDEVAPIVGFLTGEPRQGKVGVGWATLARSPAAPADVPQVTVGELDAVLDQLQAVAGPGSVEQRGALLASLDERLTADEAGFVRLLLLGEVRQGALAGLMADAVAKAARVPVADVRRAAMLGGDLGRAARAALAGGAAGLAAIGLQVLHAVQPMLAGSSSSIADALAKTGPASVEWKLDGARVQLHRQGDQVRAYTRNLNEISERLPAVVEQVRALAVDTVVLDGEVVGLGDDGRPRRFQDTIADFATSGGGGDAPLHALYFDVLHLDGHDLVDRPLVERRQALRAVAGPLVIPAIVTSDAGEAERFMSDALARGHEGVMVKALDAPYAAGRRGQAWRKVKPVHTLDLVVLAAEWGHGRRVGWLSNLHLGARGSAGSFVMVGKTFKGLSDELLAWQTRRLQEIAIGQDGHVVHVRPALVVEIAIDGVQASPRYPGGVALRFARVRRYRPDKEPADATPIEDVQALLPAR